MNISRKFVSALCVGIAGTLLSLKAKALCFSNHAEYTSIQGKVPAPLNKLPVNFVLTSVSQGVSGVVGVIRVYQSGGKIRIANVTRFDGLALGIGNVYNPPADVDLESACFEGGTVNIQMANNKKIDVTVDSSNSVTIRDLPSRNTASFTVASNETALAQWNNAIQGKSQQGTPLPGVR